MFFQFTIEDKEMFEDQRKQRLISGFPLHEGGGDYRRLSITSNVNEVEGYLRRHGNISRCHNNKQ